MNAIYSKIKQNMPARYKWWLRQFSPHSIRFSSPYPSWREAADACSGYGDALILERVLEAGLKVKNGEAAYERDGVVFDEPSHNQLLCDLLKTISEQNDGCLNVLDFGGALGSVYFQHADFLSQIRTVRWHVVEQNNFVAAGRAHFENTELKFFETVEAACEQGAPHIVLFSAVLQYIETAFDILEQTRSLEAPYLYIDRIPVSTKLANEVVVQNVPERIYKAAYPMWVFGADDFHNRLAGQYDMIEAQNGLDGTYAVGMFGNLNFKTLVFRKILAQ